MPAVLSQIKFSCILPKTRQLLLLCLPVLLCPAAQKTHGRADQPVQHRFCSYLKKIRPQKR